MTVIQKTAPAAASKVVRYFEEAGPDYFSWSHSGNMHFGYFDTGQNPFDREGMLNRMSREVGRRLGLIQMVRPLVLDLGCGLGASSRHLAELHPGATFAGFTVTPWQVRVGNGMSRAAGLAGRVQLEAASFTDLPLPDASADAAFAIESACYAGGADKAGFVRELHRVLRPGGRFVVTDGFRQHSRPLPRWLERVYRRNLECWALDELADIHQFADRLKQEGFSDIRVEDVSWRVAPSFAHIPFVTLQFAWEQWRRGTPWLHNRERRNNVLAPFLGMIMGLSRRHFRYYLVSGRKER